MKLTRFACATVFGMGLMGAASSAFATNADCPNGGTVRFGIEPYEAGATLAPIFQDLGKLIAQKLDCNVETYVTTSYNAEIEAMRAGKLEFGEFGPLGYVLAHQVANAQAIATFTDSSGTVPDTYTASIVTWPDSGIKELKDVAGHSFAFSDPASTSGHLFPAYGLQKGGIDPDKGVKGIYAGSHTASYEAIKNHKVDAGELNSEMITAATAQNNYDPKNFVTLWKSDPIPVDPIAVRGDLPEPFKTRLTQVLQNLDLTSLATAQRKHLMGTGPKTISTTDSAYNLVRDLIDTLHVDLAKL
ncbi:MAG TPA: phosphate/phosphite/phosphonate ABC transporter substrate-binding protein [Magnetospirillaceae bacterium]|jgi:phosphonate transport system substrate-binding protein